MANVNPDIASIIAHMPEVRGAVRDTANERAEAARALLEPHRKSGRTQIEVTAGKTDYLVSLTNPRGEVAALSIELGYTHRGGKHVEGLHILGRAFGV